jgi:hypothetical protein
MRKSMGAKTQREAFKHLFFASRKQINCAVPLHKSPVFLKYNDFKWAFK